MNRFRSKKKTPGFSSRYSGEQAARKKNIGKKKLLSTIFFDRPTLVELGIDECARMMLAHCGLGNFYNMSAPTYAEWTVEFLTTLDDDKEEEKITFHLGGNMYTLQYDQLNAALGITKYPSSDEAWGNTNEQFDFWCYSTSMREFDAKKGEYNYMWSHPCLRLAHKVIRMAWLGQSEINKVPHLDLETMWTMTPQCTLVKD